MSYRIGDGPSFATFDEMMKDSRARMTTWQRIRSDANCRLHWWLLNPISSARCSVRLGRQRLFRGWDDSAVWSLDDHLSKTLGAQLVKMADVAHGWPGDEWGTFEEWTGALREHGEALLTYQRLNYDLHGDDWDAIYEPARDALRWVADNFGSLWT